MQDTIILDNYQLSYSLTGSNDKPLIVFLHGFLGDRYDFQAVISRLGDRFSCLTIDLPGHGNTKVTGEDQCYQISPTAQAIIQLLDKLQISQCFLIGYSMGGRLALYLTLHYPHRFLKVILESTSPGLKTELERLNRLQSDLQLAYKMRITKLSDFISMWYNQPLFISLKKHPDFKVFLQQRLQNNPVELSKSLRGMSIGRQPSLWHHIKHNTISVLLLVGEQDDKFQEINTEMAETGKNMSLKIIEKCGHNIHLEHPEIFINNILDFFK